MTDDELLKLIDRQAETFKGQITTLYQVVGIIVVGRLFGWRVVRLTIRPSVWRQIGQLFGDPKELMPERGRLAHRSVGLKITDELGEYWSIIRGSTSREEISSTDRKMIM
jgi:hypothetical protein